MEEMNNNLSTPPSTNQINQSPPPSTNKSNVGKIIGIIIAIIAAIFIFIAIKDSHMSLRNYEKIKEGMTYEQVVDILGGKEGEISADSSYGGYSSSAYIWTDTFENRVITVIFFQNKVLSKAQSGLK
ncbi:MAG: DUF3862 domain-containing protein [Clostridia bacterium]|nr:DUF3862 domain-containing protein [Clostridia bacterium]